MNASDALDKLCLEAFRDEDLDVDTSDLFIWNLTRHRLVENLREVLNDRDDDPSLAEADELLNGTALLAECGGLEDLAGYAGLLADRRAARF